MSELIPLVLALIAVGALAGLSAGLLGVGGGAVMVPALFFTFLHLGVPQDVVMHCAVATSSAVIIVNSIRSVRAHHRAGNTDMDLLWPQPWWKSYALWIGIGAFLCAAILAPRLSSAALTALFGGVAILVAAQFVFGRPDFQLRSSVPRGAALPIVGGSVGGISALMGIGGGSLSVPLLSLCGVSIHRAIGTAAGFGLAIALPGTLGYILSGWGLEGRPSGSLGYVNLYGFALITAAAWFFVPLGAKLASRMKASGLRRVFGVALVLIAFNMIRKSGLF